jgi:hypothetical protein
MANPLALPGVLLLVASPPLVIWSWRVSKGRGSWVASVMSGFGALVYLVFSTLLFMRLKYAMVLDNPAANDAARSFWFLVGLATSASGLCLAYCAVRAARGVRGHSTS